MNLLKTAMGSLKNTNMYFNSLEKLIETLKDEKLIKVIK